MNNRHLHGAFVLVLIATCAYSTTVVAQDESKYDVPDAEVESTYDDPKQERTYREVVARLQEMKFAENSTFVDEDTDDGVDWFVVGGTLTDKRTGEIEANFNTFQGIENVAHRVVEFENGSYGSRIPAWHVFHRYGGSREADRAMKKVEDNFQDYLVKREQDLIRRQQAKI